LIIANRQQHETEQHMLVAAQNDNDYLTRENKTLKQNFIELIENQNKMEVCDIWLIIKIYYIYYSYDLSLIQIVSYELSMNAIQNH